MDIFTNSTVTVSLHSLTYIRRLSFQCLHFLYQLNSKRTVLDELLREFVEQDEAGDESPEISYTSLLDLKCGV